MRIKEDLPKPKEPSKPQHWVKSQGSQKHRTRFLPIDSPQWALPRLPATSIVGPNYCHPLQLRLVPMPVRVLSPDCRGEHPKRCSLSSACKSVFALCHRPPLGPLLLVLVCTQILPLGLTPPQTASSVRQLTWFWFLYTPRDCLLASRTKTCGK